jgi:hypothetical protein
LIPSRGTSIQDISLNSVLESVDFEISAVATHAPGPSGFLPITPEMLLNQPSGNLFGLSQNVGMGWDPARLLGPEILILSTHGGLVPRTAALSLLAFTLATGRSALSSLKQPANLKFWMPFPSPEPALTPATAARKAPRACLTLLPFATTPLSSCAGSCVRSPPALGIATCDKGLLPMMMALAAAGDLPTVLIPGGVTLLPEDGEDAGKVQTIGAKRTPTHKGIAL